MIAPFLISLLPAAGPVQDTNPEREELNALMQRCGEEVTWHQEWEPAAAAARDKKGLILVVHQAQGGYETPDMARIDAYNRINAAGKKTWIVDVEDRYEHGHGVATYLARYVKGGPIKNQRLLHVDEKIVGVLRDKLNLASEITGDKILKWL